MKVGATDTFAVDVPSYACGWLQWLNRRPVQKYIYRPIDGFILPTRDRLPDRDKSKWPVDPKDGKRSDPWQENHQIVMKDLTTDELLTWTTTSWYGKKAIGRLIDLYAREAKSHAGLMPVVTLSTRDELSPDYGLIPAPVLAVVDWQAFGAGAAPPGSPATLPLERPRPMLAIEHAPKELPPDDEFGEDDAGFRIRKIRRRNRYGRKSPSDQNAASCFGPNRRGDPLLRLNGVFLMTSNPTKPRSVDDTDEIAAPDPFDIAALRLPPSFNETAGVKKLLSTVPVRKPHRQEWIRVHPDPAYRGDFATILLKEEAEFNLVVPELLESLRHEITTVTIYTVINRAGVVFLWPARHANTDGRRGSDAWYTSAHEAAEAAMKRLTRVTANISLGAYEIYFSDNPTPENEPVWPELSFKELLRLGFEKPGRFIKDLEHPVVKMLRGM